jgi:hypothetical protein
MVRSLFFAPGNVRRLVVKSPGAVDATPGVCPPPEAPRHE